MSQQHPSTKDGDEKDALASLRDCTAKSLQGCQQDVASLYTSKQLGVYRESTGYFFYIYPPWETCQPQADSILMEWLTVCQRPKSLVSIYVQIAVGRHPKTNPGKNRKITKKDRKEEKR
ncbi:hypothetical protein TNCV_4434391 [Trichonephila clavipes]|nr:hypothetical protein TNCV_4434391 [Trichonephila clavipes]